MKRRITATKKLKVNLSSYHSMVLILVDLEIFAIRHEIGKFRDLSFRAF